MFQALLICFREGLEAFLIVAIAALFLRKAHNTSLLGALRMGVLTSVVATLAVVSGVLGVGGLPNVGEAQAARLEGQQFDDTQVVADRTLRLNGLGLRGVAWVKAFVAGLYLPAPTRDASQAMAMPGPKRLRMKIMLEAPSRELSKAVTRGVSKNENEKIGRAHV